MWLFPIDTLTSWFTFTGQVQVQRVGRNQDWVLLRPWTGSHYFTQGLRQAVFSTHGELKYTLEILLSSQAKNFLLSRHFASGGRYLERPELSLEVA